MATMIDLNDATAETVIQLLDRISRGNVPTCRRSLVRVQVRPFASHPAAEIADPGQSIARGDAYVAGAYLHDL